MKWRQFGIGIAFFILALAIGAILMYRLTHQGHMGIGLIRGFKLSVIMLAALGAAIYNITHSL